MAERHEENSSGAGRRVTIVSCVSGPLQGSIPQESHSPAQKARPSLWTSIDRPGRNGMRNRHHRKQRLARSIKLSPEQLRDILLFKWKHEDEWNPEVLFTYVPRTFETAVVSEYSARLAIELSIGRNFFRHVPAIHAQEYSADASQMRRCIYVFACSRVVPEHIPTPLRNLPNVLYVEKPPVDIRPDIGYMNSAGEKVPLRLDDSPSFGTEVRGNH